MKHKNDRKQPLALWFKMVSITLALFGIVYVVFGLKILPVHRDLLQWESALYGAIMTGWGITLLMAGRIAFREDNRELKKALIVGLTVWLAIEAAASIWFGVWFNAGVDVAVLALFAIPLVRR